MITVACVLKTGGIYTREWVHALKRGLNRHLDGFEFVCLTDDCGVSPVWRVPLEHSWPGWWSKLELFRPGLFSGSVLYMDLDTLVVGDLSDIASYDGPLAILDDFYRAKRQQSAVMAWTPGEHTAAIYDRFLKDPSMYMRRNRSDQEFIESVIPEADRLQPLYPGQLVSLKVHCSPAKAGGPPDGARLVCGHGNPRFSDPGAGWAHREWLRVAA